MTPNDRIEKHIRAAAKKAAKDLRLAYEAALEDGHEGSVLDLVDSSLVPALAEHFGDEFDTRRAPLGSI